MKHSFVQHFKWHHNFAADSIFKYVCFFNSNWFLASGDFRLLITFANSLDPDQDRQNVGPDLDPNFLTLWQCSGSIFLKKLIWKTSVDNNKSMKNYPTCKLPNVLYLVESVSMRHFQWVPPTWVLPQEKNVWKAVLTLKAPRKKCIWKCHLLKSSAANNCLALRTNKE